MENITAYELALIAGAFTVLGALIGALAAYWLTTEIEGRKMSESARAAFRAAFAPTLAFIYIARHHGTHDRPDADAHINITLLEHGTAVEIFRPFVSSKDRTRYQDAWENYRKLAAMGHNDRTSQEWGENIEGHEVILERSIFAVLAFADA